MIAMRSEHRYRVAGGEYRSLSICRMAVLKGVLAENGGKGCAGGKRR